MFLCSSCEQEDGYVYPSFYLSVISEVPVDEIIIKLRIEQDGEFLVIEPTGYPTSGLIVSDLAANDLTHNPYVIRFQVPGSAFEGAKLFVEGRQEGILVAVYAGEINLYDKGIASIVLRLFSAECDFDGDGFLDCKTMGCCQSDYDLELSDCEDGYEEASPFAFKLKACFPCLLEGIDYDCDGIPDFCVDNDTDGFEDCDPAVDCDPTRPDRHITAVELCDGVDNNCDGVTDEGYVFGPCTIGDLACGGAGTRICSEDGTTTICVADSSKEGSLCSLDDLCLTTGVCSGFPDYLCVGVSPLCDDGLVCTLDSCNEGVCLNVVAENACFVDEVCYGVLEKIGECGFCDPAVSHFSPVFAANGDPCFDDNSCSTDDACQDGECVGVTLPNATICDDERFCTAPDICNDGVCVGLENPECKDDGNSCTTDGCDETLDACIHPPTPGSDPCDDGDICTTGSLCTDGACKPGTPLFCDDDNVCTSDGCNPLTGSCFNENNTLGCDDGDSCSISDSCSDGECSGIVFKTCDDSNPCTDNFCDENGDCQLTFNEKTCAENQICKVGQCELGTCFASVVDCNDGNPCTSESCDPVNGCQFAANSNACNDGDPCTLIDVCQNKDCQGGLQATCNDENPCTQDICEPGFGCTFVNDSQGSCDDGEDCTQNDLCVNGSCVGFGAIDCNDSNVCTDDFCVNDLGCVNANNGIDCNDGNFCSENDHCSLGQCSGNSVVCVDNNLCTDDTCDSSIGCVFGPNVKACDDGISCTEDEICNNGNCVGIDICNDGNECTVDVCDGLAGACQYTALEGAICDDGQLCTEDDSCVGDTCLGAVKNCDDGVFCTTDLCKPSDGSCAFTPVDLNCQDEFQCTVDVCDAELDCLWTPTDTLCDDENQCTDDSCDATQGCVFTPIDDC